MKEILPDVFTWPSFSERFGYDFNGYLVRHAGGNVCVDPVAMSDEVLAELKDLGVAITVLTNRNHFRACEKVRAATGARVTIHAADAAFVRERGVTVDEELEAGDHLGPLVAVAAPGKSPGEVALHWPQRKILIVGDACVGKAPGVLGLLPDAVIDDAAELRRSLARLCDLDFDALLVGDGTAILSGAQAVLAAFVNGLGA